MLKLPERPVRRLVGSIHAHPYMYLLGAIMLTALMGALGRSIKLKTKIRDLLPASAPSVQAMEVLTKRLGNADILIVTIKSNRFDDVKAALPALEQALVAHPDIARVQWRQDVTLIDRNALTIFPSLEELEEYYRDLSDRIRDAVKKKMDLFGDDDDSGEEGEEQRTYSWAEWEDEDGLSDVARTFRGERGRYREFFYNSDYTTIGIKVYPTKSSGDLKFCRKILKVVDGIVTTQLQAKLGPIGDGQIVERVDLGGGYKSALKESDQIKGDIANSAIFSFGLLALIVIVFFRSFRGLVCVLLPLIMGTVWTVGLVSVTVGYLNLLTAFIFAVLLGLGIDFGIHFYGRYREERASGKPPLEAMVQTHLHCGEASILAATTTAAAFLALTLADFRGFSQFGGVAAAGVLLCLVAVVIVFPAIAFAAERLSPLKMMGYTIDRDADGEIKRSRFPLGIKTVAAALLIGGAGYAAGPSGVVFELDMNKLGTKVKKKSSADKSLQKGTVQSSVPAVIFANSGEEARSLYKQLERRFDSLDGKQHPRIKSFQTLFSLVPDQQAERRRWVGKICRKLRRKVKLFEGDPREGADELLKHCDPVDFVVDDLPDWVKQKFSDTSGKLGEFIFVNPRGSVNNGEVALAFREEMLSLRGANGKPPVVSGKPLVWAEVIIAMKSDGVLTTGAALLVVVLLLFLFERKPSAVFVVLLPLICGLGMTIGAMAIFGIKLNFFNMLALPTIIGMGVDDGVHMFHRYKELGPNSAWYIVKTTGMSAVLTTATTSVGFGSLMTANHYGLNSLGLLTVIGMVSALVTTLLVLPAALTWMDNRRPTAAE